MTLPSLSHDWPPEDELPASTTAPAPLPDPAEPLSWVRILLAALERRRSEVAVFDDYYEGIQPLNFDEEFRAAFGRRWARFASNYSALVVDRLVDRLEVQGFRFADASGDADLWDIWQANDLDGGSAMAHTEALIKRGAYALVEPRSDALPRITVEDPFDAITAPDPRDRRRRLAGLKRWIDESGHLVVYLYLPEWVASLRTRSPIPSDWTSWLEPKAVWPDTAALEPWAPADGEPLVRNPLGVVPLVPLRNRPRLRGAGRSEIEPVTSNQDAINYFRAMTVVGARFLAYPQRVLLNVVPEVDPTTGLPKKPFKAGMQQIWMIEPPDPDDLAPFEPKVESFAAADLTPLLRLVEGEVRAMAAVAGMPYELLLGQTSLLPESGEAKKSGEAALVQKLARIQVSLGEDWEIVMRLRRGRRRGPHHRQPAGPARDRPGRLRRERWGLVDAGLEWSVASSGWTSAWRTATWEAMIGSATSGAFDVLVVGYVSRFLRNLKQTLIAVEDHLHTAGVVVLFADERLLSSDPSSWDQFIREAHEAEAYSRKLSKRVSEGYAAKRRRLGVPGGNKMPYGLVREGKPSTLRVDEEQAAVVIRAYQLAASGSTDWEVAAQTGLAKTHVSEVLTNPIYAGRLRTGEPAAIAPIVDPSLWSTVQTRRERRRTRTPGRIVKGRYALRLCCAGCGKYLFGDVGRYRHPAPTCEGFLAATPGERQRYKKPKDSRAKGHSYPQEWYEDAIGGLLGELGSLDDHAMSEVVRLYGEDAERPDELTLARIEREREEASQRLAKTRDIGAWQATMARLDAETQVAMKPRHERRLAPAEVVEYLRSLPSLWADAGPEGRQALASALFTKLEVEGYVKMTYELTPDAVELGLSMALPATFTLEEGGFGRGERI